MYQDGKIRPYRCKASKRTFVKCIRMEKSDRTGAYIFKEDFVATDKTKEFFEKK